MKKVTFILGVVMMSTTVLTIQSCDTKKADDVETMEEQDKSDGQNDADKNDQSTDTNTDHMSTSKAELIDNYLELKDALTKDDEKKASKIAAKMTETIKGFDSGSYTENQQSEIKEILGTALEHAEHIEKNEIVHQREHFKDLSADMIDLIAITGNEGKLYEQYCPMYDNNKGATWLSTESKIENPYYGSKMLSCGEVKK